MLNYIGKAFENNQYIFHANQNFLALNGIVALLKMEKQKANNLFHVCILDNMPLNKHTLFMLNSEIFEFFL
jgi:hypothetical protein